MSGPVDKTKAGNYGRAVGEAQAEEAKRRRWAMITGSTRGLGMHLALELYRQEWNVILHGRSERDLEECSKLVAKAHTQFHAPSLIDYVAGNVAHPVIQEAIIAKAIGRKITLLVNNAGMYFNRSFDSMPPEDVAEAIAVNLLAPMLISRGCLPALREQKGLIVNINSMAAHSPAKGESVYAATKAGLEGFSKAWKLETMPVRIIDVFLGAMNTRMTTGRPDPELMIQPAAAARSIYQAIATSMSDSSVRFDSLDLRRGWYSSSQRVF